MSTKSLSSESSITTYRGSVCFSHFLISLIVSLNLSFISATQEFVVISEIAAGGYGAVYKVRGSIGGIYALKLEKRTPKRDHYKLQMEVRVLQAAAKTQQEHLPTLIDHSEPHSSSSSMFIIMTLLGKSLGDIKRVYRKRIFRFVSKQINGNTV